MKKLFENLIGTGFLLFVTGAFLMVGLQIIGIIFLKGALVIWANNLFHWIVPLSSVMGLLCFILPYLEKNDPSC